MRIEMKMRDEDEEVTKRMYEWDYPFGMGNGEWGIDKGDKDGVISQIPGASMI